MQKRRDKDHLRGAFYLLDVEGISPGNPKRSAAHTVGAYRRKFR